MSDIGGLLLTAKVLTISVVAIILVIGALLTVLEWIATDGD